MFAQVRVTSRGEMMLVEKDTKKKHKAKEHSVPSAGASHNEYIYNATKAQKHVMVTN